MGNPRAFLLAKYFSFIFFIVAGVIHIYLGRITGDEGFFAYSSSLIAQWKVPYKDFMFMQAPMVLYVYGVIITLFGKSLYIVRWFSFLLGLLTLFLVFNISKKISNLKGALISLILIAVNLNIVFDFCSFKTQSLSSFLLALSLYFVFNSENPKQSIFLSIAFICLAIGTRLSVMPSLFFVITYLYFTNKNQRYFLIFVSLLAIFILCIVYGYFYYVSDGKIYYDIYKYHIETSPAKETSFFVAKRFFILSWFKNQSVFIILFFISLFYFIYLAVKNINKLNKYKEILLLLSIYFSTSIIHFFAPFAQPTYQTTNIAIGSIFTGSVFSILLKKMRVLNKNYKFLIIIVIFFSIITAYTQEYLIDKSGGRYPIEEINAVVNTLKQYSSPNNKILTFDASIAFEGDFELLPGLNASEFSFYPTWSKEKSKKYNVVNLEIIYDYIKNKEADFVCLRDWDVRNFKKEDIINLNNNYEQIKTFKLFGQFMENLHVFVVKKTF